jgi:hypothetical protein
VTHVTKKNKVLLKLLRERKAAAAATNAIKKPDETEDEYPSNDPIIPKPLNKKWKLKSNIIGAEENKIPAENASILPFFPRVKPLRKAVKHPKIIMARVTVKITEM